MLYLRLKAVLISFTSVVASANNKTAYWCGGTCTNPGHLCVTACKPNNLSSCWLTRGKSIFFRDSLPRVQKHPWTLKRDIVLNIPLMLRCAWLSLLSISLLCSGLCTACVYQRLLGNNRNSCSHRDLTSFFLLWVEDPYGGGRSLLIIPHRSLQSWSCDQPETLFHKSTA